MAQVPEFFKPMNQAPQTGDLTEVIFKAAQMSMAQREQQRQAVQGVVNTFLTLAKLKQEDTKVKMDDLQARAVLEETKRQHDKDIAITDWQGNVTSSLSGEKYASAKMGAFPLAGVAGRGVEKKQNLDVAKQLIQAHFDDYKDLTSGRVRGNFNRLKAYFGFGKDSEKILNFGAQAESNATVIGKLVMGEDRFSDHDRKVFSTLLGNAASYSKEFKGNIDRLLQIIDWKERSLAGGMNEDIANAMIRNQLSGPMAESVLKNSNTVPVKSADDENFWE